MSTSHQNQQSPSGLILPSDPLWAATLDALVSPAEAREALWRLGILRWKLRPQQLAIYDTIKRLPHDVVTIVLLCSRQFGKSVLGVLLACEDCQQNPGVVVVIIAPKVEQAAAIVRPRMRLLTKDAPEGLIRPVKSENTWYFENGSELRIGGSSSGAVSQRGKTLHKVYLEEFGPDADPDGYLDFIQSDLLPTMTQSAHMQIVYMTTPPKIPDHPFVLETIPEARERGAFFRFTIDDNVWLSPAKKAQIVKACGGKHTIAYRREYMCEIVRDDSIILVPEFKEELHVREFDLPPYRKTWIGGDTGGVRDKTVLLLMAYDFERAKTLIVDEVAAAAETATADYIAAARAMERLHLGGAEAKHARWVDAPGQLRVDLAAHYKWPVMEPRQDELEPTVNQVRLGFTKNEIEVHPRCKLTLETLRSGHFNDKRTDLARTKALGHMDAFMALAYGLRHKDASNPYPQGFGLHSETMHIPDHARQPKHPLADAFRRKT